MQDPVAVVLGRTYALQTVGLDTLDRLSCGAFLQPFPADIVIQQQDVRPDFLHVLISGSVELVREEGEIKATIGVLAAGSLFIAADVVADSPTLSSVVTLGSSVIAFIPASRVRDALATDPQFGLAVLRVMASDVQGRDRDLSEMKALTAGQRLGRWVLREQGRTGLPRFQIPYPKRVLAALLGMSPENLSRSATGLAAQGARFTGRTVEVTDAVTLALFSHPRAKNPASEADMSAIAGQASSGTWGR